MAISMQIPESLYKYRTFSNYLLQDLCGSESHFASPGIFNDPLDSKPSIGNDITLSRKEQLLKALCKEHRPHKSFEKVLENFRYLASEFSSEADTRYDAFVTTDIERMLRHEVAKRGILSLRSEVHTSELQSLMRNSYAVFCLKKK